MEPGVEVAAAALQAWSSVAAPVPGLTVSRPEWAGKAGAGYLAAPI
jgi:hypothetical protein